MYAVMEMSSGVIDRVKSYCLTPSPMVKLNPSSPFGVTRASVYIRLSPEYRITVMEFRGRGYVVVTSSSVNVTNALLDIRRRAESFGGYCEILSGVQATEIAVLARDIN